MERCDEWEERYDHHGRLRHHFQNRFDNLADRTDELERQINIAVYDRNDASSGFTVVPTVAGYTVFITDKGFSVVPTSAGVTTASTSHEWRIESTTSSNGFAVSLSHRATTDGVALTSPHVSSIEPTASSTMAPSSINAGSTAKKNSF